MKTNELIKGQWYTCTSWKDICYIKFDHLKNDEFYFTERISDGEYEQLYDWYSFNNNYVHVPVEEIQKYLPHEKLNTYGLKVGDHLPEAIIRKWSDFDKNYTIGDEWYKTIATFFGDRKIKSFKLIDGHVGFEVSDTISVFLKAEGFKEFMNSYDTFVLPKNWQLKITPENEKFINSIRDRKLGYDSIMTSDLIESNIPNSWRVASDKNYPEITLEQFKKYVLKDPLLNIKNDDILFIDEYVLAHTSDAVESIMENILDKKNKDLIIPIISKSKSNINYNLDLNLPDLNINLVKNKPKQIKQIQLKNFSITI